MLAIEKQREVVLEVRESVLEGHNNLVDEDKVVHKVGWEFVLDNLVLVRNSPSEVVVRLLEIDLAEEDTDTVVVDKADNQQAVDTVADLEGTYIQADKVLDFAADSLKFN